MMPAPKAKEVIAAGIDVAESPAAIRMRRRIELQAPAIVDALIDAAVDGDVAAARCLVERVVPVAKTAPIGEPVTLTGDLPEQAELVKRLLAQGRLSLEEAESLHRAITTVQGVTESSAVLARLAEVERRLAALGDGAQPTRGRKVINVDAQPALPVPTKGGGDDL